MAEDSATPDLEELARLLADAYNRRDYDATLALYSLDAVFDTSPLGMGVFEGREAIRGVYEDWQAAYADLEISLEEIQDLGVGVLFVVSTQTGRLRGGAGAVQLRQGWVTLVEDGLVGQITVYTDIDAARAAAERLAEKRSENSDF